MLKSKNILDLRYHKNPKQKWHVLDNGIVELTMEHKGPFAWVAQKFFDKPRFSYIKLDELGSFVWLLLDEVHDVNAAAEKVHERFGEKAEPLLPRLGEFFNLLERYGFIVREE